MKRLISILALTFAMGFGVTANAANVGYIVDSEPWGFGYAQGNVGHMDTVFGSGNWDALSYASGAAALGGGYDFLYLEGGDGQTAGFQAFVNANRSAMESFVAGGGRLLINAATWYQASAFDLGFGAFSSAELYSYGGHAVGSHDIFNGPFGATGTDWGGNYFSHNYITGGGTGLITDDYGNYVLTEMNYGAGLVLFGGMTSTGWHYNGDQAAAEALRRNILYYAANGAGGTVPEPTTVALFGAGLVGLVIARRRKAAK